MFPRWLTTMGRMVVGGLAIGLLCAGALWWVWIAGVR